MGKYTKRKKVSILDSEISALVGSNDITAFNKLTLGGRAGTW